MDLQNTCVDPLGMTAKRYPDSSCLEQALRITAMMKNTDKRITYQSVEEIKPLIYLLYIINRSSTYQLLILYSTREQKVKN